MLRAGHAASRLAAMLLVVGLGLLGRATPAEAMQLLLAGDERITVFGSPLPGTRYSTGWGASITTPSAPRQRAWDERELQPGPRLQGEAKLSSITLTPLGRNALHVQLDFEGTADGQPDLVC